MVGIGLVCALAIVTAFRGTAPTIAKNRAEFLRKAIFNVVPGAASSGAFRFVEGKGFVAIPPKEGDAGGADVVYAAYDAQGNLAGIAIAAAGMGYQDTIRLIYGYSPEKDAIVGFQVLESRETPGLGDRINSDPDFLSNFRELSVRLDAALAALEHPLKLVKSGERREPWELDAITGATVSSRAVTDILTKSTAVWIPRLKPHAGELARGNTK
jgi:electron transport complex protein RnfG